MVRLVNEGRKELYGAEYRKISIESYFCQRCVFNYF